MATWEVAVGAVSIVSLYLGVSYSKSGKNDYAHGLPKYKSEKLWFLPDFLSHTIDMLVLRTPASMKKVYEKYGTAFGVFSVLGKQVWVTGPSAMKWAFRGDRKYVEWLVPAKHWLDLLGTKSLAGVHGEAHRRLRKCLSVAFTPSALTGYQDSIQMATKDFLDEIVARTSGDKPLDVFLPVKQFTMDIALRIIFSADSRTDTRLATMLPDYIEWFGGLSTLFPFNLPFTTMRRAMNARDRILNAIRAMYQERMTMLAEDPYVEYKDVLHNLLMVRDDDGEPLSEQEILETVFGLLFAGHDTSMALVCSSLYVMDGVASDECKQKLSDEINTAFPDTDKFDYAVLSKLPYLDAFVKEMLRMYGPIAGMPRTITADTEMPVVDKDGREYEHFMPAGSQILLDFKEIMHDERYYARPEQFEPERFLAPREEDKQSPFTFVPFGGGIRLCIGAPLLRQEIKLFLAHLVRGKGYSVQVVQCEYRRFPVTYMLPTMHLYAN